MYVFILAIVARLHLDTHFSDIRTTSCINSFLLSLPLWKEWPVEKGHQLSFRHHLLPHIFNLLLFNNLQILITPIAQPWFKIQILSLVALGYIVLFSFHFLVILSGAIRCTAQYRLSKPVFKTWSLIFLIIYLHNFLFKPAKDLQGINLACNLHTTCVLTGQKISEKN